MATLTSRSHILATGGIEDTESAICRLLPTIVVMSIVGFKTTSTHGNTIANELNGFAVNIYITENNSIGKPIQIIVEKFNH